MVNITVIAVGKLKEKYLREGIDEYLKRLGRFCRLEIIEVPDERISENPGASEIEAVKKKEGDSIKRHIKDNSYKIALCIEGTMLSSEGLASKLKDIAVNGASHVVFIIGGSLGLSSQVVDICDFKLSFSPMTFPHQLMRLILLEQVYRSFKINNNEVYHK